ncbi:hypothetical protein HGRIS_014234 [Hohenbuehelia grisea]|uniref:Enhancer of polycomb-like protein n=1 Tax=Hohenbuehelia grisea TaxID=104357 RepID=A0ABR3JT06_9AGAR
MDERDQEWLEKNNEEARGEGTSVQGAVSAANSTRTSARSAKAKGKEPESTQPVAITEDLFELVMGLFEKATHEKTEFLHHSLGAGMAFPAFTEYQDIFSLPIPSSTFASFSVPEWIPSSPNLFRIARTIYPYWKERRIERGGQRIIPPLNGDEADTLNESYVCFRRREIKAVRKTRASQASSSDKLARLQAELAQPLELAKLVLQREAVKKETLQHSQGVWGKRMAFADLKRKFPSLGDKADDELLYDREKEKKKAKVESTPRLRPKDAASPAAAAEAAVLPSARSAQLQSQIEREVQRQKDRDHHWEDSVDNVYQALPVPLPSRAFKFISSTESTPPEERLARQPRALRLRYGRGGRVLVDRRQGPPPSRIRRDGARQALSLTSRRHSSFDEEDSSNEDTEWEQRLLARWRFDQDDYPHVGPHGSDEQDRVLVDDFNPSFMRHNITLLSDSDMQNLATDATLTLTNAEGRQQQVTPFRLGPPVFSRLPPARLMPSVPPVGVVPAATPGPVPSATPVSAPAAVKKIPQPPAAVPQMRISSNGGIRSPSTAGPTAAPSSMLNNIPAPSSSPPHTQSTQPIPVPVPIPTVNGVNGVSRGAINMPHLDAGKSEISASQNVLNSSALSAAVLAQAAAAAKAQQVQQQQAQQQQVLSDATANAQTPSDGAAAATTPVKLQPQAQHVVVPNGYHATPLSAYAAANLPSNAFAHLQGGLSQQQLVNLKTAFANSPNTQDIQLANGARTHYMPQNGIPFNLQLAANGGNINAKLANARQIAWTQQMQQQQQLQQQRPGSAMNGATVNGVHGVDASVVMNGSMSPSPRLAQSVPVRSPSANGSRMGMRSVSGPGNVVVQHAMQGSPGHQQAHSMSPHMQHATIVPHIPQAHSPPRAAQTPIPMPSPSLQPQQPVGNVQGGF